MADTPERDAAASRPSHAATPWRHVAPRRRVRPLTRAAALVVVIGAILGGCSGGSKDPDSPTTSGTSTQGADGHSPSAGPSKESPTTTPTPKRTSATIDLGTVKLVATGTRPSIDPPGGLRSDGTATVSVPLEGSADLSVSGGTLSRETDGTLSVRNAQGSPVAAVSAPASSLGGVGYATVTSTDVKITWPGEPADTNTTDPSSSTSPPINGERAPIASMTVGTDALKDAHWGDYDGGRSLAVVPTDWARGAGVAGTELLWTQLIAAQPQANTPGMQDQFTCHAIGARDKASWNLEPWRPDVGLAKTIAARCNPKAG